MGILYGDNEFEFSEDDGFKIVKDKVDIYQVCKVVIVCYIYGDDILNIDVGGVVICQFLGYLG